MTQIAKLCARAFANPSGLSFREFERLLEAFGFVELRQRGSHHSYRHPATVDLLVIQPRKAMAKDYQVRQFFDIVETNRLTLEAR